MADVAQAPPLERPRAVVIAVILLWTELALGLLDSVLDWKNIRAQEYYQVSVGFDALFVLISVWINYKVWQGRNWARIVALVFTALGLLTFLPQWSETLARSTLISTLYGIELLLDVAAMYLVFFPGRSWFARR